MVEDHPTNPWAYISWGDSYNFFKRKDEALAREMYEKAREVAKHSRDRAVVRKRLADL